jgi:hypothetical protein
MALRRQAPNARSRWPDPEPRVCLALRRERHGHRVYGEGRKLLQPALRQLHTRDRLNPPLKQTSCRQDRRCRGGLLYARKGRRSPLKHYRRSPLPAGKAFQPGSRKNLIDNALNREKVRQPAPSNRLHSKPRRPAHSNRRRSKPPQLAHSNRQRSKPPQLAHSNRQRSKPPQLVPPPQLVRHPL